MSEMRAETRFAMQLFLYGDGKGAPVRNVARLSELSGVSGETIRKHLPAWEEQAAKLLGSSSEVGLAIALSAEKLQQHEQDMRHLRKLVEAKKWEIERQQEITARLEGWLNKFNDEDKDQALKIFDAWQRSAGVRGALEGQFLALQKQWTALSGIVDLKDISVVRQKEIAKGQAKLELKKQGLTEAPTRNVVGGVFDRRIETGAMIEEED
jgi:hypothetical protein